MRSGDVIGILNGADYNEWNPELDKHLPESYTADTLDQKQKVKSELLLNSLPDHDHTPDLPLVGMVTRLTAQKGIDLLERVLEPLLQSGRSKQLAYLQMSGAIC